MLSILIANAARRNRQITLAFSEVGREYVMLYGGKNEMLRWSALDREIPNLFRREYIVNLCFRTVARSLFAGGTN